MIRAIKRIIMAAFVIVVVLIGAGVVAGNYLFDRIMGPELLGQLEDQLETVESSAKAGISNGMDKLEDSQNGEEVITSGELEQVKEQISTLDKAKVVGLVGEKLSMDEIKDISAMASEGISSEELQAAKEKLKEKLSSDDIEYLKTLYEEYR